MSEEKELSKEAHEFTQQHLPDIIKHLEAKSPQAEQFLIEIARLAGLEEAILFDGTVIRLGADEPDASDLDTPPNSDAKGG